MNKLIEFFDNFKIFCKNLWIYKKILWNQRDWDYAYLLNLEKFKFSLMIKHFINNPYVDHDNDIKWISICIKLIDIILEEDSSYSFDLKTKKCNITKYVNTNNSSRFVKNLFASQDSIELIIYKKEILRQQKALYLYNKIRYNYLYGWWD